MSGKRMVKWVGQEDSHGCGVASLAMITGQTYAAVKQYFSDADFSNDGKSTWDWDVFLAEHGYAVARKHMYRLSVKREEWPCKPFGAIHLCQVRVSDAAPMAHMVVMLGDGIVLDPLTPEPKRLTDYVEVYNIAAIGRIT